MEENGTPTTEITEPTETTEPQTGDLDALFSEFDLGMSPTGMADYKAKLKAKLLTDAAQQFVDAYAAIETAVNAGWVGTSKERFLSQLKKICDEITADLKAEYDDLDARLSELAYFYVNEDAALIAEDTEA